MDFSTLTAAVDLDTVVTAVIAIGAILALPNVAKAGVRRVLSMIK